MKRIGIAVVVRDANVLVGVRAPGTALAGCHEFPGGKCLESESPAACAVRECHEETGLKVEILELLQQRQFTYPEGTVDLSFFLCRMIGDAAPDGPFQWVPAASLAELRFPDANRELIALLIQRFNSVNNEYEMLPNNG